jgi:hypothetical protein
MCRYCGVHRWIIAMTLRGMAPSEHQSDVGKAQMISFLTLYLAEIFDQTIAVQ